MVEYRKIQLTGGSTSIVSLPKRWASDLKQGDKVAIVERGNDLIISKQEKKDNLPAEITFEGKLDTLLREAIAYYLNGYTVFKIKVNGNASERDAVKQLLKDSLMGLEILEETEKEIIAQTLLMDSHFSFDSTLNRIYFLVNDMLVNLKERIETKNFENFENISQREREVDRFFIFGFKQLMTAVSNPVNMEELGIESEKKCIQYSLILHSLEGIADYVLMIVKYFKEKEIPEEELNEYKKIYEISHSLFQKTFKALLEKDSEAAENLIQLFAEKEKEFELSKSIKQIPCTGIAEKSIEINEIILDMFAE